jgi:2-dehydro-3-deoxygluconokinase
MMKVGAFGEIMLRLTPPEKLLLEQSNQLRMSFTGTGVNILGSLAHFGVHCAMMSKLPDNRLGLAAGANLRMYGIETTYIDYIHNHMGSYFAELGFGTRPTYVTYQNRAESSFGISGPQAYDFDSFLKAVDLVHVCGISLSLTEHTWQSAKQLIMQAHKMKKKVCFDFNFRPSLNTEEMKKELMKQRYEEILPYCDIVFGSIRDLTELLHLAEMKDIVNDQDELKLIKQFQNKYDIEWFSGTRRKFRDGKFFLSGFLSTSTQRYETNFHELTVYDRIGAGDAFAAGILLGYLENWPLDKTVEFSLMNALLAHTTEGDVPLFTRRVVEDALNNPQIDLIR